MENSSEPNRFSLDGKELLESFMSLGETTAIEFKLAGGKDGNGQLPKSFWETYSSFANTRGGIVVLGVREGEKATAGTFEIVGIPNPDQVIEELYEGLENRALVNANILKPEHIRRLATPQGTVIMVIIPQVNPEQYPIYLHNDPQRYTYYREGDADRPQPSPHTRKTSLKTSPKNPA